jgi:hypothetical protein
MNAKSEIDADHHTEHGSSNKKRLKNDHGGESTKHETADVSVEKFLGWCNSMGIFIDESKVRHNI